MGAVVFGELDGGRTDTTSGTVDEDALVWFDVGECAEEVERGETSEGDGGGLFVVEVRRDGEDGGVLGEGDELGVGAEVHAGRGEDFVPHFEVDDIRSDGFDFTCEGCAEDLIAGFEDSDRESSEDGEEG